MYIFLDDLLIVFYRFLNPAGCCRRPELILTVQKIYVFLLVRSSWLRVSVVRDLAQRFGRSVGRSGFGAGLRGGLRRSVSVCFVCERRVGSGAIRKPSRPISAGKDKPRGCEKRAIGPKGRHYEFE